MFYDRAENVLGRVPLQENPSPLAGEESFSWAYVSKSLEKLGEGSVVANPSPETLKRFRPSRKGRVIPFNDNWSRIPNFSFFPL